MKRRALLAGGVSAFATGLAAGAPLLGGAKPHVIVVGGGYGGATAAKYLQLWGEGRVAITLVEPNAAFVSCPLSNLVLSGTRQLAELTLDYSGLAARGISVVRDSAVAIDTGQRSLRLAGGQTLPYDKLVLSPGVDFMWEQLPGLQSAEAQARVPHAWKAGPQTLALRAQLQAMPDGGVFAMSVPLAPFRCPPAPYERACQVALYLSRSKPKSKLLILDANEDVVAESRQFKRLWAERYPGMVDYRPNFSLADVHADTLTAVSEFDDQVKADVLNVIPPQRAADVAVRAGLANINKRWCEVDFLSFASTQAKDVHVLGDAVQIAPAMAKAAHMANQHAKACAAAVLDGLEGRPLNDQAMLTSVCYSFVSDKEVLHVAGVHAYDAAKKTYLQVPGTGGASAMPSEAEAGHAMAWAHNIWDDALR
jgi:NADPH-dependent 2,4-dienoyl-CoA reductase/sulfur reductase-like enzyme